VVKNNHINVPRTTLESLNLLEAAVNLEQATIISVSGGGDPLHNYLRHTDYYSKLYHLCQKMNLPLEMHTSYIESDFPYEICHRVVYHLRYVDDLPKVRRHGNEIVRVVFVATEDLTRDLIDDIASFVEYRDDIDELSFRQMVDKDYQVTTYCQEYLRLGHKKRWWYIEQNDYNTYYVEGKLYYKYSDISKEEKK
jgi:hypothetical protein